MRKIILGISYILVMLVILQGNAYATDASVILKTDKNEFNKNEEILIKVDISGITTQKGIAVMTATLEYDKESLELANIEGKNSWSKPIYNESNGKLITDKNSNITTSETVLEITFKVKENSKQNLTVTLKEITASEGIEDIRIANSTKEIVINGEKIDANIEADINAENKNNSDNNQIINASTDIQNQDTINKNVVAPKNNTIKVIAVIIAIIVAIILIRIRIVKERRKRRKRKKV